MGFIQDELNRTELDFIRALSLLYPFLPVRLVNIYTSQPKELRCLLKLHIAVDQRVDIRDPLIKYTELIERFNKRLK